METQTLWPTPDTADQVLIVSSYSGAERQLYLKSLLKNAPYDRGVSYFISCDYHRNGIWAGLKELFEAILADIRLNAPHLITKYDREIITILPEERRNIIPRSLSLTDSVPDTERVRSYPMDRAFRIVHGLVDLFNTWHKHSNRSPITIVCDDYERASSLVQRFMEELMRRVEDDLSLFLVLTTNHDKGDELAEKFDRSSSFIALETSPEPETSLSPMEITKLAQMYEEKAGDDPIDREIYYPLAAYYWPLSDRPGRGMLCLLRTFSMYTKQGFYEDALHYGETAFHMLETYDPSNALYRWHIMSRLYYCHTGLQRPQVALQILQSFISRTDVEEHLHLSSYLMAMLYARFLPNRDLEKAEYYLDHGFSSIEKQQLPLETAAFQRVFNRNGLALVRHFQGRYEEAIELCKWGYEELDKFVSPTIHSLHRSVLLYNIAQVYVAVHQYEQAIGHYTEALTIDPNYSEYYNDRGNLYLKMGRLEEALSDYECGIELSPPYPEIWTNLGQCYRLMGRPEAAIEAYSRAIDLDPKLPLPFAGRAEAFEELEQLDAALADYDMALTLKSNQPLVLANRAILHYTVGHLMKAVSDLDRAIVCAPELPELYQNRAIALTDLGRYEEATQDLQTYLRLCPDAVDRAEVEHKLSRLLEAQAACCRA